MRRFLLSSSVLLSLGVAAPGLAHHVGEIFKAGELVVSHAWMLENAEMGHSTSVYLTVENQDSEPDTLIDASVPFADEVVFQGQTVSAEGVLEVEDLAGIKIGPGQVLTLKPGVVWIELESVHATFEHGQHFDMTLVFERAGDVDIEVEIEPVDEDEHEHEDEDVS